uniref:Hydrogenase maturation protease n=1 Tax=Eiseniibacteriota bacterium TaxID=2212470 RepID=A0A832I308_UNCEI
MVRVIGVGNPDREDDAAGIEAVRRLAAHGHPGVEARVCRPDPDDLLTAMMGAARVIVVDAMAAGTDPGTVVRIDATAAPVPAELFRGSTHGLGVAEAVELARHLGVMPRSLVIYGIEGRNYRFGKPLSRDVSFAVEQVVDRIEHEAAEAA